MYCRKLGNTAFFTDKDIGIQPAAGINPPILLLCSANEKVESNNTSDTVWTNDRQRIITNNNELITVESPFTKPCSVTMAEHCQTVLSPRELSLIEIGMYVYMYSTCTCSTCTCIHVHVRVYTYIYMYRICMFMYSVHVHVQCTCTCIECVYYSYTMNFVSMPTVTVIRS